MQLRPQQEITMLIWKKKLNLIIPRLDKDVIQKELSYTVDENINWYDQYEKHFIHSSNIYQRENKWY